MSQKVSVAEIAHWKEHQKTQPVVLFFTRHSFSENLKKNVGVCVFGYELMRDPRNGAIPVPWRIFCADVFSVQYVETLFQIWAWPDSSVLTHF